MEAGKNMQILEKELKNIGFEKIHNYYFNLPPAKLIEIAVKNNEGFFSDSGSLVVDNSPYTGRSPNDKYYVDNGEGDIWLSDGAQMMAQQDYAKVKTKVISYLQNKNIYIRDMHVGNHPTYAIKVRVITDTAWQNLASNNLFIPLKINSPIESPDFSVIVATGFEANPLLDNTRSKAFIIINFHEKVILIGASKYVGEIKKSVFTIMNYLMPKNDVLSLHCSANVGHDRDVALFFGLSGTGKTTLSSDTSRALIGDDEHGWCSDGVFNFEGGCYAKTIRLKKEFEPLVWSAIHRFQAILENVPLDNYRKPDFDSNIVTENTRAAYPISFISNSDRTGRGSHPSNIFLLTADAFGVLPPIARLSIHQALYYFVSGYTSKLAGTERGLGQEPQATFSSCFGSPFLPLHPGIYADLLENRLKEFKSQVWLLNTGWTGGGYGKGERIYLPYTRAMIDAVLNKKINNTRFNKQPLFRLDIPEQIPGVPQKMLDPVLTWDDKDEYQKAATKLANEFIENMKKFEEFLPVNVIEAGPLFAK